MNTLFFAWSCVIIFCIGCMTFLAYHGKEGWGWLILVVILLTQVEFRQKSGGDE